MKFKICLNNSKNNKIPNTKIKNFKMKIFGKPPLSLELSPS